MSLTSAEADATLGAAVAALQRCDLSEACCTVRVGNEPRTWQQGETIIFDDSIEHEARNDGNAIRIVLLFEIWRPELSAEERQGLIVLYEAINLYTSQDAA
jgi:aspartyl/asparaginyl beta-hydroxylase (cupin superfamily)